MLSRITKYRATTVSILEIPIVGLIILRVYPDILLQQFIVSLKVTNKLNPSLVIKRPIKIMLKSNSCPRRSTMSNIKSSWHERDKEPIAIQQAAVKNETWRAVKTKTDAAVPNCELKMVISFRSAHSPKVNHSIKTYAEAKTSCHWDQVWAS